MGATCDAICCEDTVNHTQPDTEQTKTRTQITNSDTSDTDTDGEQSHKQTHYKKHISLYETFHIAIANGDENMVAFYLGEYPTMNLLKSVKNNDTVLHTAVKNKQYKILEMLLAEGASVNKKHNITGTTALHLSVNSNDIKSVKILLKFGADAYITNESEISPLSIAQRHKYRDILDEFGEDSKTDNMDESDETEIEPVMELKNNNFLSLSVANVGHQMQTSAEMSSNEAILRTYDTPKLDNICDDIFADIQMDMKQSQKKLLSLKAWMDKKQSSPPHSWQKRWVVVTDGHLLWSERQMSVQNGLTKDEKKRWNKCLNLNGVTEVTKLETKKQRKFKVSMKGGRDYLWRAKTAEMRDKWVDVLNGHVEYAKMTSVYSDHDQSDDHIMSPSTKK